MKKLFLLGFLIFLIMPFTSASLPVTISTDSPSLNLNYGESQSVQFTINNEQNLCSLNCIWQIYDMTHWKKGDFGSDRAEPNTPFYRTFTLTAPTQGSGTIEYLFSTSCNEITGGGNPASCSGINQGTANYTIFLNYGPIPEVKTCYPNWNCGSWSNCVNGEKTRGCNDGCGNVKTESEKCCIPDWSCNQWSNTNQECGTRTCIDINRCGTNTGKPITSKSCPTPIAQKTNIVEPKINVQKIQIDNYPIVFVHGFTGDDGSFEKIENKLKQSYGDNIQTWKASTYDLSNKEICGYGIADHAEKLNEEILNRFGNQKINLVAHSMGGLISKYYIEHYNQNQNVNKLIMLGTPTNGASISATIGSIGEPIAGCVQEQSVDEMVYGSPMIKELNNYNYYPVRIYSIYSSGNDGLILSNDAKIFNGNNIEITPCVALFKLTHLLLTDPSLCPQAYNEVINALSDNSQPTNYNSNYGNSNQQQNPIITGNVVASQEKVCIKRFLGFLWCTQWS